MNENTRGAFVKTLTVFAGATCFRTGLKAALAEAASAGKPLLTADNLNRLANGTEPVKGLAAQAADNLPLFLRERFHLTSVQDEYLNSLPEDKMRQLKELLNEAAKNGGPLTVTETTFAPPLAESEHHVRVIGGHAGPLVLRSISVCIPIIGCYKDTWGDDGPKPKPLE